MITTSSWSVPVVARLHWPAARLHQPGLAAARGRPGVCGAPQVCRAAETRLDTVPSSPAEVKPKALDDIKGVEEVPVSKAEPDVVEAIETKIDPDRQ